MKQKMPARGEAGYAVFLTVSGRGIQFPALYRSTCRALTEGKAMERFWVAEAEEYYPGMLESTLVSRRQMEAILEEADLARDSAEEMVCLAMNDRSQGCGVLLCRRAGRLLAAHWAAGFPGGGPAAGGLGPEFAPGGGAGPWGAGVFPGGTGGRSGGSTPAAGEKSGTVRFIYIQYTIAW